MSTRPWPYPDLRNGTTIHHITDTHLGNANAATDRLPQITDDLDLLKVCIHGHMHTGDMVDWDAQPIDSPEDQLYKDWRAQVRADGLPYAEVVGNHDAQSFNSKTARTSLQWAQSMGLPHFNTITDMGDIRIIGLGPDTWTEWTPTDPSATYTLSAATLTWLDQQLSATSRPCFIATHIPPAEQYTSEMTPMANIDAIVSGHSNVVGWLSGHRHANPTEAAHAGVITVGGRKLFAVNGPAAGGRMVGVAYNDYWWQSPCLSMFITYLGDALDVRWRDHLDHRWSSGIGGDQMRHILLAA